ncbi:MAG: hypothetical protein IIB75_02925 [Proteobacteria bacterium]|nr:hypothetical protein [Pseudomonadota bacterium]
MTGGESWAQPLLAAIKNAGGVRPESKSFLFELRFADALHECGITPVIGPEIQMRRFRPTHTYKPE